MQRYLNLFVSMLTSPDFEEFAQTQNFLSHHRESEVPFSVKRLLSLGTLHGKTSRLPNNS